MIIKGKIHTFGDHVDTDVIIPARHLNNPDPAFLAQHCMEDIDEEFASRVRPGDIMVCGVNFGCGSSREHAPVAIKAAGIRCVIAKSFARIFFRNAINIGLAVLECPEAVYEASAGDEFEVDLSKGIVKNLNNGLSYTAAPFPEFVQNIICAGGLIEYISERMAQDEKV